MHQTSRIVGEHPPTSPAFEGGKGDVEGEGLSRSDGYPIDGSLPASPDANAAAAPRNAASAARELLALGFSIVPVQYKQKYPSCGKGWPSLRLTEADIPTYFPVGRRSNIGIMLGGASVSRHGVLVDVDIDCNELLARADELLPATGAVFGRASRPRSHRLYWCTGVGASPRGGGVGSNESAGVRTLKWLCPVRGTLAEIRADGAQTVAPGSVHTGGEAVRWEEDANGQPGVVAYSELVDLVTALCGQGPGQAGKGDDRALGTLSNHLAKVRAAAPGNRNNTLYLAALRAGSLTGAGRLNELWARRSLLDAAKDSGLSDSEAVSTIDSGLAAGKADPDRTRLGSGGGVGGGGGGGVPLPPHPPGVASESDPHTNPLVVTSFDAVEHRPLRWLWRGVLPLGKLCCICGDPGLGKSFLTVDLAARLSRGELLDGEAADTLLLNAEDDPGDTVRPRLAAAGARLERIRTLVEGPEGAFTLDHAMRLDAALETMPACRLVVIDPVSAYFPERLDPHRQTDVRRVLRPLAEVAQKRGVTILVVAHMNKDTTASDVHRVSGSTALPAACRAVWLVKRDGDEPDVRVMKPVKMNLTDDGREMWYRLTSTDDDHAPRVIWEKPRAA